MTSDQGASDSDGYGLYQATFSMPTNQASGAYVCLWPASNAWPGPEIDFVEQRNGQAYLTVHWKGSGDSNQSKSVDFSANLSKPTTVALSWESSGLTFSVDGSQVAQFAAGGSVPVPKDYATAVRNEAFRYWQCRPGGHVHHTLQDEFHAVFRQRRGTFFAARLAAARLAADCSAQRADRAIQSGYAFHC